jgi:dipeptidyl-peptidase-4
VGGLTQWWAQEGIIQVVMDNRSSGHFGRKGMNYVFKKLGIWEIEDYLSCAKWLKTQPWVDNSKIGITGGSYGGYITCLALTYGSDVFTHGIANYSVTDWQLYDSHYTERFMKTPEQNPEGYKNTSVMTYAWKYKGGLRIVHGSTDDNVHMQNSIQLIDVLQDMNKSFEFMIYPNQRHGIGNTKARHNLTETCRFIYKHLLGKELPKEFN